MPVSTAQAAVDNWAAAMAGGLALQKYKAGVSATTVNPMQEAARPENVAAYLDGVQQAVNSGRYVDALLSAPAGSWKDGCLTTGAQRYSGGVNKGKPKYARAAQKLAPIWQQQRAAADAIQGTGREAAKAKMNAALDAMLNGVGK